MKRPAVPLVLNTRLDSGIFRMATMLSQNASTNSSMTFFPVLLFAFVLVFLCIVLGGAIIMKRMERGGGRKRGPEPMCASCGYSVTGLTTMVCPECGADLREVGIIPAAKSRDVKKAAAPASSASANRTVTILLTDMKDYISLRAPRIARGMQLWRFFAATVTSFSRSSNGGLAGSSNQPAMG